MPRVAQSVLGYVRKQNLLRAGDRVGIAVSGGADSVALLRLMIELRSELGIVLSVVHLNHKLRGLESDADEQFVRDLAADHGLEFIRESCDVRAFAAEKKLSLEAAAREARYEFFRDALQRSVNRIATAHTLDDQAETVLLKLTRGAGTRGLAGIYPRVAVRGTAISHQPSAISKSETNPATIAGSEERWIVRPLLGMRRSHLQKYLAEVNQSWREDSSNQDLRHTRNRVRHEVLPRLEWDVNPSACESLAEAAEIARAEEEYWITEVSRLLPQLWSKDEHGGALKGNPLDTFPLALRRRLVRSAAESLGLMLEFRHGEAILSLDHEGDCSVLPAHWMVTRHGQELKFQNAPEATSAYEYELPVPGTIVIAEAGIELETFVVTATNGADGYNPEHLMDSSLAQRGLVVRNWRPGERFWPAHTKEPKKIKELLQDRHITGEEKRRWPVVASGGEIVWVRGLGARRDFQSNGNQGLLIRELPERKK